MLKKLKNLVKDALSVTWIRKSYEFLNRITLEIFASNRLFASIYSVLGFLTFNREQFAVLRARRNYYRNINKERKSHVELRRNIHRLEKGMAMVPMRNVFAKDYIGETIEYYEQAVNQCKVNQSSMDQSEMEWSHDVLARYFKLVDVNNQKIGAAYEKFKSLAPLYTSNGKDKKVPFERKTGVRSDISYENLLNLSMQRRSVRWYENKKVPRELIDKALLVGRQSPTACNRMPYEFKIYDDPEMVKKVAGIPFGAGGFSHQIPTIAVVVGKLDSYFSPRDRHAIYIDSSLAAMPFMMALETLGLSSTVINWPDFEPLEIKMQKTLGLDTSDRVIMLIAIGYADPNGVIPYSQKKDLNVIRSYNELPQK